MHVYLVQCWLTIIDEGGENGCESGYLDNSLTKWAQHSLKKMYIYRQINSLIFNNFIILLPLRFCVIIGFGDPRSSKMPFFCNFGDFECWFLVIFSLHKFMKNQNSVPLNLSKWQFLRLQISQLWFHVKSEWQKNYDFSALGSKGTV